MYVTVTTAVSFMAGRLDMRTSGSGPHSGSPEIDADDVISSAWIVLAIVAGTATDSTIAASAIPSIVIFSIRMGCVGGHLSDFGLEHDKLDVLEPFWRFSNRSDARLNLASMLVIIDQ